MSPTSRNVFEDLGIPEPDVELAKADLAIRIQRLAEHRRLTPDEAAALLKVPTSELPALFQGSLATYSVDQLLRTLTWLGDDVEILIRPRLQPTKRGVLRVLQAAAVERPDDFEPVRQGHAKQVLADVRTADPTASDDKSKAAIGAMAVAARDDRHLLDTMPSRR
jgi:predicted XRE-type DNA-binding protein